MGSRLAGSFGSRGARFGLAALLCICAPGFLAAQEAAPPRLMSDGESYLDMFLKGGWLMWPILLCAIAGLTFCFERMFDLRRKRHIPTNFEKDVIFIVDTRGVDAGLALCLDKDSSLARVLYAALLRYTSPRQEQELAAASEGERLGYDLRRNGRWIILCAVLAPMIGLLGSVFGAIDGLDQLAGTGAGGSGWAGTLAIALIPFAFGLLVATPLVFGYILTRGQADDLMREISAKAVESLVAIDRKARRSIRQIEDIEEFLETKDMDPAKPPPLDLDKELESDDLEKAIKTSVTTPAHAPIAVKDPNAKPESVKVESKITDAAQPPREIKKEPPSESGQSPRDKKEASGENPKVA